MANKDLFKQAIAEAKSVREAAIANAKEALEETLTPHLKDMLAAKLQEMDAKSEEVEEVVNEVEEEVEEGKHKDKDDSMEEATTDEVEEGKHKDKDDSMEEAKHEDEKDEAVKEDLTDAPEVAEAEEDEAEDDTEESEDEADDEIEEPAEEGVDGDEELGDLTVDQFKDMIRDIINTEMGGGDDLGADDMDAGDIEGMGDEDPTTGDMSADEPAADDEEIDLDELLAELEATTAEGKHKDDEKMEEGEHKDKKDEAMHSKKKDKAMEEETSTQVEAESDGANFNVNRTVSEEQLQKELDEALETIEQLKGDLHETNLLNSKLLYVNKIFKANNLNESQKVNIIAAFDKAETVKEVKLVFETVSENVVTTKKEQVSESKVKGIASKATGTAPAKPEVIAEVSDAVRRMQKLAGIIK